MYYWAADRGLMMVEVSTAPTFKFGKPKLLFRLSEAVAVTPQWASVSRDGERVLIAVHPAQGCPSCQRFRFHSVFAGFHG